MSRSFTDDSSIGVDVASFLINALFSLSAQIALSIQGHRLTELRRRKRAPANATLPNPRLLRQKGMR